MTKRRETKLYEPISELRDVDPDVLALMIILGIVGVAVLLYWWFPV